MRDRSRPVLHLELHTGDLQGAVDFYAQLCGWRPERIEAANSSYTAIELGRRGLGGGIVQDGVERPLWLPYIGVEDAHRATRRAESLGAAVLLEPRQGPAGWRSIVASPTGGQIAFWQAKR
jgi:predicted enzyme related to lactoylglutathione lyase